MEKIQENKSLIALEKRTTSLKEMPGFFEQFILGRSNRLSLKTQRAYTYKFKLFLNYLHDTHELFKNRDIKEYTLDDLAQLTYIDILRYQDWLYKHVAAYKGKDYQQVKAQKTVSNHLACISSVWTFYCRTDDLRKNPVKAIERAKQKEEPVVYITPIEKKKLLEGISMGVAIQSGYEQTPFNKNKLRDFTICYLLLDTGMRVSELCGINIEHLNLDACSVMVTRKGGYNDIVYYSDEVSSLLQICIEERYIYNPELDESALFLNRYGQRLGVRSVETMVKRYCSRILYRDGETKVTPHKLRSSFGMQLLAASKNIDLVAQRLGHKSLSTVSVYARNLEKVKRDSRNDLVYDPKRSEKKIDEPVSESPAVQITKFPF